MVLPRVHTAAIQQFERYARATGIAFETILSDEHRAVIAAARTSDQVSAQAIVDIFQIVAMAARRDDLGVGFAMWCNLRGYGPLSLLWDHCTSVEQLLRLSGRYLSLETEAIQSAAVSEGDEVAVQQFITVPTRFGGSQYLEATLTMQLRTLRNVLGQQWHPLRMEFAHPAPEQLGFHRSVFRCPLQFGADRSALVLHRDDLARTSPNGNAHLVSYLERQLESTQKTRPESLARAVERHVVAHLAGGGLTIEHVAASLGMGVRTLQRALSDEGQPFSAIIQTVRRRVANDYFTWQRRPNLAELAHRLGYAEASAASRFLRGAFQAGTRQLGRKARATRNVHPSSRQPPST